MTLKIQDSSIEETSSDNSMDTLDAAARRRIQNRLNQRASRKRKALESKQNPPNRKWVVYTEDSNVPKPMSPIFKPTDQSNQTIQTTSSPSAHAEHSYFCEFNHTQRDEFLNKLQARAVHMLENPVLSPHPSFCLTQFSLLNAMFTNANLMGLTMELLNEDLASQFNLIGPSSLHLPPSLWPSKKQKKIIHHPWIDLLPMVSLREGLLARAETMDEDEACGDLYGVCASSHETGLRVWGEAWDPLAYEASENLIRKWSWLIKECPDIIKSTNYWRRQRGEKAIVIKQK